MDIADQIEYLKANYLTMPQKTMAKNIGRSYCYVAAELKRQGLVIPQHIKDEFSKIGMFRKGKTAANKGKPMSEWASKEQIRKFKSNSFKKGNIPHNTKDDSHISLRAMSHGGQYFWIRLKPGHWVLYHRYLWQVVYGKIPKGALIQFKDGDTLNCDINNLYATNRKDQIIINQNGGRKAPHFLKDTIILINKLKLSINEKQN